MSDNQLQKLRDEKEGYAKELELLKKAMKPSEAAEKITVYIKKSEDPFCVPADNEWASAGDNKACCIIM